MKSRGHQTTRELTADQCKATDQQYRASQCNDVQITQISTPIVSALREASHHDNRMGEQQITCFIRCMHTLVYAHTQDVHIAYMLHACNHACLRHQCSAPAASHVNKHSMHLTRRGTYQHACHMNGQALWVPAWRNSLCAPRS